MHKTFSIAPLLLVVALSLCCFSVLVACGDNASNSPDVSDSSSSVEDSDDSDSSSSAKDSDDSNSSSSVKDSEKSDSSSSRKDTDDSDSSSSAKKTVSSSSEKGGSSGGNIEIGAHAAMPSNQDASAVQSKYDTWMDIYYVEMESDPDAKPNYLPDEAKGTARIKWSETDQTVSEGIGYGMLFAALMGDTQKLDKLLAYNKLFRLGPKTGNNLMAWKMNTYESSTGGSATDADIDIAAALLIAYQKTGNSTYKDEALLIAKSIWEWEVSTSTKLLLPAMNNEVLGDGHLYNISYMSLAALKMFAAFDSDHDWNSVLDATLAYLQKVQDAGDGLWPDWSDPDGAPIDPDNNSNQSLKGKNGTTNSYEAFQKEAVRIPWRIAWYYSWFGDERAKALLDKAQAFIASQGKDTPNSLNAWYAYSGGNMASGLASTYMWASYCAFAMGSASNQDWLNACNERLLDATIPKNGYYNASLQLMYNLLFNGFYKF